MVKVVMVDQDLEVYRVAFEGAVRVFEVTKEFPKEEDRVGGIDWYKKERDKGTRPFFYGYGALRAALRASARTGRW